MKWQNKVQLIGYLGKDPSVVPLSKGGFRAVLFLATNNGFTQQGKKRETYWHTVKFWGKDLAYIQNQLIKGSHVLVDGSLIYDTYPDRTGHLRYVTEIRADKIVNLDR